MKRKVAVTLLIVLISVIATTQVNAQPEPETGTLIIKKRIEWGIDSNYVNHPVFMFTLGPQVEFWLGDGETQTFKLEPSTYTIAEDSAGWETSIEVKGGGYNNKYGTNIIEIELEEGETITVTFINKPPDFVIPEVPFGVMGILVTMFGVLALHAYRNGILVIGLE